MLDKIDGIKAEALQRLDGIDDARDLDAWRVHYLGKKSPLTSILRSLGTLSIEERREVGAAANKLKDLLESSATARGQAIRASQLTSETQQEAVDISLPGRPYPVGRLHPITQAVEEITQIFISMGFEVIEGNEVEWDYYNFEALNIPAEHPARDNMSTFWLDTGEGKKQPLLRTHNTAVSARTLERMEPPIRAVEVGKVYRYEATDATHGWMLHQIDGIVVDKNITMADLKGTLFEFARRYYGDDRRVRFRVDYFPFVEPGGELAVECCDNPECRVCGGSGWLELLGCGMTHPDVLRRADIDPDVYTSYAFGMGIDRQPQARYGIDDMRHFFNNDLRFLRQF